jgi:hypothetical protein
MSECGIVIGSAPCVDEDVWLAPAWDRIVINHAGIREFGPISMWVSLHFRLLSRLMETRKELGYPMNFSAYAKLPSDESHIVSAGIRIRQAPHLDACGNGSSGLLAVLTALSCGYDKLILCGIPLEGNETLQENGKLETRVERKVPAFERFRHPWVLNKERLAPHVRSLSGWTREFFGGPEEWI